MQHFCKLLEVPEAPGVVPDRGAEEPAGGVVRAPGYTRVVTLKWLESFFLNHNKSFRCHLGDYEKHIFSIWKACERRNFDFSVFLRMSSVTC